MEPDVSSSPAVGNARQWPIYRTVWRWHFYAALLCVPFVIFLSLTGAIYLFKPQIEGWMDRSYEGIAPVQEHRVLSEQVRAVLDSHPKATGIHVELPREERGATRVILKEGDKQWRVMVHPVSLAVMAVRDEELGLMRQIKQLHGQLKIGTWGSYLVELAACWTIIMILTGVVLWWPRNATGFAGVLYPRWKKGGRIWWRDVHSVLGVWVSFFAIFLILTGLPWAKFWGNYFRSVRQSTGLSSISQDWTVGGKEVSAAQRVEGEGGRGGEHAEHGDSAQGESVSRGSSVSGSKRGGKSGSGRPGSGAPIPRDLSGFDRAFEIARAERLAYPVLLTPPVAGKEEWTVASDAQNRLLRETLRFDGVTGEIHSRDGFREKHWIDRAISIGIAAHEGQLFGIWNQLLGLLTTLGLIALSCSGVWMWWRRRSPGSMGIPEPLQRGRLVWSVWCLIALLGVAMPLFGGSVLAVAFLDLFRRGFRRV
jgi:uncharacterized iron-regulated membrane protein